jgi:uncharacterized membrane-anchored protein
MAGYVDVKLPTLRAPRLPILPGVHGVARIDGRTKDLTKRLKSGEIAVIDHLDLDRVAAESLVACGVVAVVNISASISGRYPNLGPEILISSGVLLLDSVGPEFLASVTDGQKIRIDEGTIYSGTVPVSTGTMQTAESVAISMEQAREGLAVQLESFAGNTMDFLRRERALLLDGVGVPDIRTKLEGRHALIVVRGYHYREDLATLRPYIREYRPIFIGVDGGADALLEAGYTPHLIVGDMDSVSDTALRCGAELVVHAYADGQAPGQARLEHLGVPSVSFPATGTSEDIAMLLADDSGASLIVAVGSHATLVEFLDKGRAGMASTFLTRLRVGGKLVDAKGVSRLYRSRISMWELLALVVAAVLAIVVALSFTNAGHVLGDLLAVRWRDFTYWIRDLLT